MLQPLENYRDQRRPGRRWWIGRMSDAEGRDLSWWAAETFETLSGSHMVRPRDITRYPDYASARAAVLIAAEIGIADLASRESFMVGGVLAHAEITYLESGLRRWRVVIAHPDWRDDVALVAGQRRRWGRWQVEPGYVGATASARADTVADDLIDRIDREQERNKSWSTYRPG